MKERKPNAVVELKRDAAGYWLVINGVAVFTGSTRPAPELLRALNARGPVMMTRSGSS